MTLKNHFILRTYVFPICKMGLWGWAGNSSKHI